MLLGSHRFTHTDDHFSALHCHPEGQFFMLLRGTVVYYTDTGEWLLTPRHPCWISPRIAHGARSRGATEGVVVRVGEDLCDGLPEKMMHIHSSPLMDALLHKMLGSPENSPALLRLWGVLKDDIQQARPNHLHLPVPRDERLRNLAQQLVENPADNRSLAQWATDIHIAERSLVRKFRQETGMSLVAWRQRARVIRAIRLLSQGESVTQVALAVGYDSLSAFISVFRQIMGITPAQFLTGQLL